MRRALASAVLVTSLTACHRSVIHAGTVQDPAPSPSPDPAAALQAAARAGLTDLALTEESYLAHHHDYVPFVGSLPARLEALADDPHGFDSGAVAYGVLVRGRADSWCGVAVLRGSTQFLAYDTAGGGFQAPGAARQDCQDLAAEVHTKVG